MIFKFRIVSDEVSNFKREIDIDASNTFLDLKNAICDSVGYDKNQMCSFFICSDDWEKEREITLEDMDVDSDQEVWLMEDTVLGDMLDDEGQKLLFVFDYMTDRSMFMELRDIVTGKNLMDPVCTLSLGQAPQQIVDIDEFNRSIEDKAATVGTADLEELDEDFYGSDDYDISEIDSEGYEEMNTDF